MYNFLSDCNTEYLNLTITLSSINNTNVTVNDPYLWSYNGVLYTETGIYSVQTGCHTEILNLTIEQLMTLYIPNAFTPNGDGINETFQPFGTNPNPDNYRMIIYDRFGKEIFISHNINSSWNGRLHNTGEILQTGVYVYLINIRLGDRDYVYKGVVALIF
jgi:gliding motility-associated-like protein